MLRKAIDSWWLKEMYPYGLEEPLAYFESNSLLFRFILQNFTPALSVFYAPTDNPDRISGTE